MKKRLYIVGPSSTGKTTLVNALEKKLGLQGSAIVREVAREVMVAYGFSRKDVASLEMQQAIMLEHLKKEDKGRWCPIQICDRSAVDPIVYATLTSVNGEEALSRQRIMRNSPAFQSALEQYRQSTFVLLAPVSDWLFDDGVRLIEHQARCFEVFKSVLRGFGIPFQEIGPGMRFLEERVVHVLGLLNQ